MTSPEKPVVAAFDFDGTLTHRDSLMPFLYQVTGPARFLLNCLQLSPVFVAYALKVIRNDRAKNIVLKHFLAGMTLQSLLEQGKEFASKKLPQLQRNAAMQRFEFHKRQGHRCIIVSASLDLYLNPWASAAGFDQVLCSTLETRQDGHTTGQLLGENCFGEEKLRRLTAALGPRESYILYAYGDSRGDKALLSAADFPYYRTFSD